MVMGLFSTTITAVTAAAAVNGTPLISGYD